MIKSNITYPRVVFGRRKNCSFQYNINSFVEINLQHNENMFKLTVNDYGIT